MSLMVAIPIEEVKEMRVTVRILALGKILPLAETMLEERAAADRPQLIANKALGEVVNSPSAGELLEIIITARRASTLKDDLGVG